MAYLDAEESVCKAGMAGSLLFIEVKSAETGVLVSIVLRNSWCSCSRYQT